MPLPFIIYSSVQMPRMFGSFGTGTEPDMNLFFSIFLSNLIYIGTLIALIVLLCRASDHRLIDTTYRPADPWEIGGCRV